MLHELTHATEKLVENKKTRKHDKSKAKPAKWKPRTNYQIEAKVFG